MLGSEFEKKNRQQKSNMRHYREFHIIDNNIAYLQPGAFINTNVDFDPEDPFTSMAKAYTELFIVKSDEAKEKYMKRMIDIFKIDGIVFHDAKTCPNNSNNRYGMPQRLTKDTGVPSITINGDLNDLRLISDEQTKTNIEAFIEQLEENRG